MEKLYGQCLEQILLFSYPRGVCLCFRQFYRREAGEQPFRQEVEEAAYGVPSRNPWVSVTYRGAKEQAEQLLETLASLGGKVSAPGGRMRNGDILKTSKQCQLRRNMFPF